MLDKPFSIDDKIEDLSKLHEQMKDLKKQIGDFFITKLNQSLKVFFTKYPGVDFITWNQYTPYFNDGEECVFTIYGINIVPKDPHKYFPDHYKEGEEAEPSDFEEGYTDPENLDFTKDCNSVIKFIYTGEDYLKAAFGDHVEVKIYSDGRSEIDEYTDHD